MEDPASQNANSRSERPPRPMPRKEIVFYAKLSAGIFLVFCVLYGSLIWKADEFATLGLTNIVFYFALMALALVPPCLLFGALRDRSQAHYRGQLQGAKVELRGPAALFFVVLILGYKLLPVPGNFSLTVYVHGPLGHQDSILKDSGHVLLDLGADRRTEQVGEKGQAIFSEVPANFLGKKVDISLDAPGYELTNPKEKYVLNGQSIYLQVRRKAGHIVGRVEDEAGVGLAGVTISIGDVPPIETNSSGQFDINIPGDQLQDEMPLSAIKQGYVRWDSTAVPDSNVFVITLRREHTRK